jgi:hypothetical protein
VAEVVCIDCLAEGITSARPIVSGKRKPRCATHTRAAKRAAAQRAHEHHVGKVYGLEPGEYERLLAFQAGRCAICRWAKGGSGRRLAVDHDHDSGEPRGLLCQPCNRELLGRHNTEALIRAIAYLNDPAYARFRRGDPFR